MHSGHRHKSTEHEKLCHLVEAASCDVSGGVMVGVVCSALAAAVEVNMENGSIAKCGRSAAGCAFNETRAEIC